MAKAEGDFTTAGREIGAVESPNYDAACFHAQQCAEKYLKARLVEAGIEFSKPHDLGALLDLLVPVEMIWESLRFELDSLTDRAVEVRYPGKGLECHGGGPEPTEPGTQNQPSIPTSLFSLIAMFLLS